MTMRLGALLLAAVVTVGCGTTPAAVVKPSARAGAKAQSSRGITLEAAIARSLAHAKASWGGDWTLERAFGQRAWSAEGVPQGGAWNVSLLGKRPDAPGYHYVRLTVEPDGTVKLDPRNATGPFPDPWHSEKSPALDHATMISAERGLTLTLASRLGKKFPSQTPFSFEAGWTDRLKRNVLRYSWSCVIDKQRWWVEVLLDPATGEIVEEDATHNR